MIIIYWHTEEGLKNNPDTKALVDSLGLKYGIKEELTTINDNYSCWNVIQKYWGKGEDIILIDQDILFTEEQLQELIFCKEGNCAFYYSAGSAYQSGGQQQMSVWGFTTGLLPEARVKFMWYAEKAALGFGKISAGIQKLPFEKFDVTNPSGAGKGIDNAIFENTDCYQWHLHGKVQHNHRVYYDWIAKMQEKK